MPHEFLVFMLCGPPANEKCHAFFRLGGRLNTDGSFSEDVTKKQKLDNSRLDSRNYTGKGIPDNVYRISIPDKEYRISETG